MTGRHVYSESLDDWAELHGEPAPEHATPEPDRCPQHQRPLTATGDCNDCLDHADDQRRAARRRWWNDPELSTIADAEGDVRSEVHDYDPHDDYDRDY